MGWLPSSPNGIAMCQGDVVVGLPRLVARANNGFVSGLYKVGAMHLYVSNGTGLWPGLALRLGKPAKLTRITLRRI
jgi:predicted MPP superfamily phosphohydrolase